METSKLLSVVVPTKNRYKYLKYLIELIASFKSDEIELVIQDNSDDNTEFVSYIESLNYDFIRYNYIKRQIPMSINSDKAILNSTGEYVCFLGDDDGLTKYTLDCVKWMKENGIEAVKSAEVGYYWPDISSGTEKAQSSVIKYNTFTSKTHRLSPYKELLKVLKRGIPDRGDMPLVYHSLVKRESLNKVFEKAGTFFPGNSPDISNAVALSLTIKTFVKIDFPLAFSGCSVFHGGGVHTTGKKGLPKITEIPWFRPNAENNWDKKVPKIALDALIWADSAISALKQMDATDLYEKINFNVMYSNLVLKSPNYRKYVYEVCTNRLLFYWVYSLTFFKRVVVAVCRRIGWVTGVIKKPIIISNILDVIEASKRLEQLADSIEKKPF